ncbi:hypothetical protein XENOCAPTIV_003910 [Xenoophorus captivus]|uniref:Uncharacterized protein n=1 Tax=Xenoophorus captivus TaxID=1517983 RepID=A0ABV0SFG8_9TELE
MESDGDLNLDTNDLPLRANTNHMLVRHYVLDLTVCLDKKIISGSIVLFLEPCSFGGVKNEGDIGPEAGDGARQEPNKTGTVFGSHTQGSQSFQTNSAEDFTLVLDCCDLEVSKVEEVNTDSVSVPLGFPPEVASEDISVSAQADFVQHLFSMPSAHWREKLRLLSLCSRAPGAQNGGLVHFQTDRWSLQVRKERVKSSQGFPRIIRIYYMTRPFGGSVRWTKDQDNRECVYTAGSPINNRALFPCQEPPVAMSTWQARVRAPSMVDDGISCSHGDYPCRFTERSAWSQRVVPHRVFSPVCLLQKTQVGVLKLLPRCLAAAHAVLGVHPFPRLDILIVPAGFSSLGMARYFLSVFD